MTAHVAPRSVARRRGQALTEFALVVPVFLLVLVALFDLGRGVFAHNGASHAAREIARSTSVHPGIVLGSSSETQQVIDTQRSLVPGMRVPATTDFECVDVDGSVVAVTPCSSGMFVRVTVRADYTPVLFLGMGGPIELSATSSARIPD